MVGRGQDGWDQRLGREREQAGRALRLWGDFPRDPPRRLVLTGQPVWTRGGFTLRAMKLAYFRRAWRLPAWAPREVLELARASAAPTPGRGRDAVLPIQAVKQSATLFDTDRGPLELPAWRLDSSQSVGAIWVLAAEPAERVWAPAETGHGGRRIQSAEAISGDSTRLKVTFVGSHPPWVDYPRTEVIETQRAVAVLPVPHDAGPPGARALLGSAREVVAELQRPIGDRVLVNLDGSPVAVLGTT